LHRYANSKLMLLYRNTMHWLVSLGVLEVCLAGRTNSKYSAQLQMLAWDLKCWYVPTHCPPVHDGYVLLVVSSCCHLSLLTLYAKLASGKFHGRIIYDIC